MDYHTRIEIPTMPHQPTNCFVLENSHWLDTCGAKRIMQIMQSNMNQTGVYIIMIVTITKKTHHYFNGTNSQTDGLTREYSAGLLIH